VGRGFVTEGNFRSVNAINARITAWGAARGLDSGAWKKTEFHQPVGKIMRQIQFLDDTSFADSKIT